MDGILLVDKRTGWTSFDVVNFVRKLTGEKKVGHLGTLDPQATGVLPVAIGKATKLFDAYLNKQKTYVAVFSFGFETDTLDSEGKIIFSDGDIPSIENIKTAVNSFVGKSFQMPPQYSAKKVGGVPAYKLARQGNTVELKQKEIEIFKFDILEYNKPDLTVEISCSSGTYIRAIARDLAKKLNTFATMTALKRTKVGSFLLEDCIDIKTASKNEIESKIIPI